MTHRFSNVSTVTVLGVAILLLAAIGAAQAGPAENTSEPAAETDSGEEEVPEPAPDTELSFTDIDQKMLDDLAQQYNKDVAHRIPKPIAVFIADERVNLHIETEGGNETVYGVAMTGVEVDNAAVGGIDRPTVDVYTSEETLNAITNAENPQDRAVQAYKDDDIRYEAYGLLRSIRMKVATTAVSIFG